jgi:hypothetical protein
MKSERLRYFNTVEVPEELVETFRNLEDILQTQHGIDGRHPLVSPSEDGFMTAEDKQRLEALWKQSGGIQDETNNAGGTTTVINTTTVVDVSFAKLFLLMGA